MFNSGYPNLSAAVDDLERNGMLIRIKTEMDPHLEMAEIQRRVYLAGGPAVFFERVKGSPFPAVSNLFGTIDRSRFLFRHTLEKVQRMVALKGDPTTALEKPWQLPAIGLDALTALPRKVSSGPVLKNTCKISDLPAIKSWPMDGGPFVTLPQVFSEDPDRPGAMSGNMGMYRIQLSGNDYQTDREIGLHYQIHRGIGVHQTRASERGEKLRVSVFVGGPPSHTLSAVMPLPEGLSELTFAGLLGGRRFRWARKNGAFISTDADFVITGTVEMGAVKSEGPFGDHLGYYSLAHEFPVMQVEQVYHRNDAIWPFTVVGRPPQEDTSFGELIHELTGDAIKQELPGVEGVHAVDAAGVHPLLLAVGSERYTPYSETRQPLEMLTQANRILGTGQLSLAKYLIMAAKDDNPPAMHHITAFFQHVLERVDWTRDLHFQTNTSIDTLDYSGTGMNTGSKVVIASLGASRRSLSVETPELPEDDFVRDAAVAGPGILCLKATPYKNRETAIREIGAWIDRWEKKINVDKFPLVVLVDDARFSAHTENNFLWSTFTRSDPARDIYGFNAHTADKHWGCRGALVIDARYKPYMAPPLVEDSGVSKRVDELAASGGPLHGLW